ncbi:MAG: cobalt-precorrin-5B (C(1))-methyltransferase [Rhizobiaceae bacterium]
MSAETPELRRGWTTGACAAAAAKAACAALLNGEFPDPVEITLPGGQTPGFALAQTELNSDHAIAAIVKDAGDDPDVTHGALIVAKVSRHGKSGGITFRAGSGVGTVTRAGLAIEPGEPAINPVPRKMIAAAIADIAGSEDGFEVEISVPGGEEIARKTLNGRLGIVGGISILGTTGIVIPYSCSSWIHSIHRGIDVARAGGHDHVAGATGSTSEKAVQKIHGLAEEQLLDMGDFVGGTLKYLRSHPVRKVTLAGGVAKMTKLAQGLLDLHSSRGSADLTGLADIATENGADLQLAAAIGSANTVAEAFDLASGAKIEIGDRLAELAWQTAAAVLSDPEIDLEILIFDRKGTCRGHMPFRTTNHAPRPLKRR